MYVSLLSFLVIYRYYLVLFVFSASSKYGPHPPKTLSLPSLLILRSAVTELMCGFRTVCVVIELLLLKKKKNRTFRHK